MKRAFYLLLALPFLLASCETPTQNDKTPEENIPENNDPQPEYALDVELAAAMRIPSSEVELDNNHFVLAFVDDAENIELGIILVGNQDDTILQAGEYTSADNTVLTDYCELYQYEPEVEYTISEAKVGVEVEGDVYTFDIEISDSERGLLHFSYCGAVLDMEQSTDDAVAFEPTKVKAELYEQGNFFLQLYLDDKNYHELDMIDTVGNSSDYLAAGTYTCTNQAQQISSWSIFSLGNDQTTSIAEAEITLAHNEDGTTTITGYIKSAEEHHITIDWSGVVDGFNFGN